MCKIICNLQTVEIDMNKYKYIDLFAGAGGMSLGFDKSGFENVLAVECDECFAETYGKASVFSKEH